MREPRRAQRLRLRHPEPGRRSPHDRLDGQRAGVPHALWGVLIVDSEARDTLYAHNAPKLFIPASNQKRVSGSVILERASSNPPTAGRGRCLLADDLWPAGVSASPPELTAAHALKTHLDANDLSPDEMDKGDVEMRAPDGRQLEFASPA